MDRQDKEEPTTSPREWLKFVGVIPADDLQKMAQAIADDCERIDPPDDFPTWDNLGTGPAD